MAPIGGTWQDPSNGWVFATVPGVDNPTGDNFAYNDVLPPTAPYWAEVTLKPDPSTGAADDDIYLWILSDPSNTNQLGIYYDHNAKTLNLVGYDGSLTLYQTIAYNLSIDRDGPAVVSIWSDQTTAEWQVNGIQQTPATITNTITVPGVVGLEALNQGAARSLAENINATQANTPPPPTLTPFLWDTLVDTAGVNLSAHTPPIGSAWTADLSTPEYDFLTNGPILMPSGGNNRYTSAATPPGPDYTVEAWVTADAGYSDTLSLRSRIDSGTSTEYVLLVDFAGVIKLTKRVAGIDTILDSATFTMPVLGAPPTKLAIRCTSTLIEGLENGTVILSATDATLTLAGEVGIAGTRTVGQPMHVQTIIAY